MTCRSTTTRAAAIALLLAAATAFADGPASAAAGQENDGSPAFGTEDAYGLRLAQHTDDGGGELPPDEEWAEDAYSDFTLTGASPDREWAPGILETVVREAGGGPGLDALGLSVYGYVQFGFTGILRGPGGSAAGLPLRIYDARRPDNLRLNQTKLTLERAVDMDKAFDLGARVDMMYGSDSQVNITPGLFDKQTRQAQFDLTQFYVQLWSKTGADGQGFDFIFGKWHTTIGAEVVDAPDNYLYSRTMLFGFGGPFTHVGGKLTYHLDAENSAYFAVVNGWDVFNDNNDGVSFLGGFTLASKERMGDDPRSTVIWNFIVGPEQTNKSWGPGRVTTEVIWTYLWTERTTGVGHALYGYENNVAGALGNDGVAETRDADWWGFAYTLNYVVDDWLNTTGRVEYFRDHHGTRTGYRGDFISLTTGLGITPAPDDTWLKDFQIRPELRADFSANQSPFADSCQLTAAIDFIYKF